MHCAVGLKFVPKGMEKESTSHSGRGRPLAFDPEQAIDAAMRVFWLKGYEGASLADLTQAMGINKPSLYAKFGDKRGLFLAAIDHYGTTIAAPHARPLMECSNSRDAVEGHLNSITSALASTGTPPGCLIGTVATDFAGRDDDMRDYVAGLVSASEAFLAQRFKELSDAPMDEQTLAELVVSLGQSLAARARSGASIEDLMGLTDRFLNAIFGPKEPVPPD